MAWRKFILYIRWPVTFGAIGALTLLVVFPDLRNSDDGPAAPAPVANLTPRAGDWQGQGPVSYADAVRHASPAVVNIWARRQQENARHPLFDDPLFRYFFNNADTPRRERMQSALGSGVIISEEGYLLTSIHVIQGADEVVVQLYDGRESRARLVGIDQENDLAVLKIELGELRAIPIGSPKDARVGDVVLAIGNPFGLTQTVTQGIISATGRRGLGINPYENFIQTDAAINPGNSGGALIDANGNLLGINTAIPDKTGYSVGIGFAVPADTAIRALNDIVKFGEVQRGWLGVEGELLSRRTVRYFDLNTGEGSPLVDNNVLIDGVVVVRVRPNSPAHSAGLLPGDVIVSVNGQPVGNGLNTEQEIRESRPGENVKMEIVRGNERITLEATLGSLPTS